MTINKRTGVGIKNGIVAAATDKAEDAAIKLNIFPVKSITQLIADVAYCFNKRTAFAELFSQS